MGDEAARSRFITICAVGSSGGMDGIMEKQVQTKTPLSKRLSMQTLVTMSIMLLIFIILSIISPKFLQLTNITNVARQIAVVVITGSAVTLLMISGNIDLSVGSVMGLSGVVYAQFAVMKIPLFLALLLAVAVGAMCGFINGFTVTRLHVTPVIATLGVMYIARGMAFILCNGRTVNLGLPRDFNKLGTGWLLGLPTVLIFMVLIVAIFIFIERKTLLGKYAFAIGGNRTAATLSGINDNKMIWSLYTITGILAAFSGVLMGSRLGVGDPAVGTGFEFDVIVAVVLGGTSLNGGEGSVIGMVIGALIVGFLGNGLNLMGVYTFYQSVLMGVVLVSAVVLDGIFKRKLR